MGTDVHAGTIANAVDELFDTGGGAAHLLSGARIDVVARAERLCAVEAPAGHDTAGTGSWSLDHSRAVDLAAPSGARRGSRVRRRSDRETPSTESLDPAVTSGAAA